MGKEFSTKNGNKTDRLTCDKYNLTDKKYHENMWPLPSSFQNDLRSRRSLGKKVKFEKEFSVATEKKETFAIILNTSNSFKLDSLMVFTESEGFQNVHSSFDTKLDESNSVSSHCILNVKEPRIC